MALTKTERHLFPEAAITKSDLAAHYAAFTHLLLPHIAGRALRCVCVQDSEARRSRRRPGLGSAVRISPAMIDPGLAVVTKAQDVVRLIEGGVLELHMAATRIDKADRPDRLVFNLEPGAGVSLDELKQAAVSVRTQLADRRLASFVMTTGARGVHIVVPLERRTPAAASAFWVQNMAADIEKSEPRRFTTKSARASRRGRVLLDVSNNGPGAYAVAPYTSRARAGATLAMPLSWDAFMALRTLDGFRVGVAPPAHDPWDGYADVRQRLGQRQTRGRTAE